MGASKKYDHLEQAVVVLCRAVAQQEKAFSKVLFCVRADFRVLRDNFLIAFHSSKW